ncbi:hypothetical protein [Streptomyces sp. NPDC059916]|uniref:hypothetical protein n=1 Tax=Streptomyces sp. NPDC059916 TaxID=3347001 RepID=UPI0036CBA6B4
MTSPNALIAAERRDDINRRIRLLMSAPGAERREGEYARLLVLWTEADRASRAKAPRPGSVGETPCSIRPAAVCVDLTNDTRSICVQAA